MKLVIAPDSFKECLSAREVAEAVASALRAVLPVAEILEYPLSDGGEGLLEVLQTSFGGRLCTASVAGPLGRPVAAKYLLSGDTALIEVAQACGLTLLSPEERNPLLASSRGVGELLLEAFRSGARHFIVGLGGSATCDGGARMLSVPGIRETLREASFEVLYDVDIPFCGPRGAARLFAPQKGASPADVEILEARMLEQEHRLDSIGPCSVADVPGAGAAGGLGGAFAAAFGARLECGIDRVLALSGFLQAMDGATAVITGEGRSDRQTLTGKVPFGVLRHCKGTVPVYLLSGSIQDASALLQAGFTHLEPVSPPELPLSEALQPLTARRYLSQAATRIIPHLLAAPLH